MKEKRISQRGGELSWRGVVYPHSWRDAGGKAKLNVAIEKKGGNVNGRGSAKERKRECSARFTKGEWQLLICTRVPIRGSKRGRVWGVHGERKGKTKKAKIKSTGTRPRKAARRLY